MLGDALYPPRADVAETLAREWALLGRPGTWLDGAERVDIMRAVRDAWDCGLCRQRTAALSPSMVAGAHDAAGTLDSATVDVVHRITTDPGRLTAAWYEREVLGGALPVPRFVEVVAVVAATVLTDTFAIAVGASEPDLPEARAGQATAEVVEGASVHSAWVPTVPPEHATGVTAELYQAALAKTGRVSNVQRALSLVPERQRSWSRYGACTYQHPGLDLTPPQKELLAVTVSSYNDCFY